MFTAIKRSRGILFCLALAAYTLLPVYGESLFPVNVDSATTVSFTSSWFDLTLDIPGGTFPEPVTISISTADPRSVDRVSIVVSYVCVDICTDKGLQPLKDITLTFDYLNSDIWYDLDENRLSVARYDDAAARWITLPSTPRPLEGKVSAVTRHLSKFAIAQVVPAGNLSAVRAFPVPFNPLKHAGLTIENITAASVITIYDVSGELVRKLNETDADGSVVWDGKNDAGRYVANGVYFVLVDDKDYMTRLKVAVERK